MNNTRQEPIYTEKTECRDCYKCVRECPVKAIRVENGSAMVIHDLCVQCGHCVEVCPVGAKRIRDDRGRVRELLRSGTPVYVSLAPSFRSEFPGYSDRLLTAALRALGFAGVSETALGAEEVSAHTAAYLDGAANGVAISTACPVAVRLIEKYHPEHKKALLPYHSPMIAHARLLHRIFGDDVHIVFIGPCIAKKMESDRHQGDIAAVLTFHDLREMLAAADLVPEKVREEDGRDFVPEQATAGRLYPVDGGMLATILTGAGPASPSAMAFSGLKHIRGALKECTVIGEQAPVFLELLACEGGCINGPACANRSESALKRYTIVRQVRETPPPHEPSIGIQRTPTDTAVHESRFPEADIREALRRIGKYAAGDELNCSGCGYESCRDFAAALLLGKAEETMCISYMRKLAQNKANALIRTMPSGMVIVDEALRIVECNRRFCSIMGEDIAGLYDAKPGLEGANLTKIVPFDHLFRAVLENGKDIPDRDIRHHDRVFNVSIFTIEPHRYAGGIIQDITTPSFRKEQIISRANGVIRKNLETVQQIAYLLGENAAETEVMLESIIASFRPGQDDPNAYSADETGGK